MYYGTDKVFHRLHKNISQLLHHISRPLHLPVNQEMVLVSLDGVHLVYFIPVPAFQLHALYLPFVLAGSRTSPQQQPTATSALSGLRQMLMCEQLCLATSMVPMVQLNDKWVESNSAFMLEVLDLMEKAQKDPHLFLPSIHIDITSSNAGLSQYLRAPVLQ